MAEIFHLRCRHCGETMQKSTEPYCEVCNLYLCYRAMPILLGMMMTGQMPIKVARGVSPALDQAVPTYEYPHARYILD